MLTYKYADDWFSALEDESKWVPSNGALSTCAALRLIVQKNTDHCLTLAEFIKTVIQFILNNFDADNTLFGFFQLLKLSNNRQINPFIATHDYCIKILSISQDSKIVMNISPIYHLGPDYPEYYEKKQGKKLNPDAILGLLTSTTTTDAPFKFNLGIDAGVAFSQNPSSHNKKMILEITLIDDGILAILSCDDQTTSKIVTWDHLGMPAAVYNELYTRNIHDIWAA